MWYNRLDILSCWAIISSSLVAVSVSINTRLRGGRWAIFRPGSLGKFSLISIVNPSSSIISHVVKPSCMTKPGNISLSISTNSIHGHLRSSSATTASFSTGSILQVEYTSFPPGRRPRAPRSAIVTCRLNRLRPSSGRHFSQTRTFLRVVAEPEHGTSAIIAS